MNKKIITNFINIIHGLNGWCKNERVYPRTIWRKILPQIVLFMRCICDGYFTEKWNKYYHAISVPSDEICVIDENSDINLRNKYGLLIGDRYWIQTQSLMIEVTGDQYPVKQVPEEVHNNVSACLAKIHAFDHQNLHQTLMIIVPFIITGLSQYNPLVAELYHMLVSQLNMDGNFAFYSQRANCKICVYYYVYHNGDWPWKTSITLRCLGHGSLHPYIYWIYYENGNYRAVSSRGDQWLQAVEAGIKPEHMPWRLDETQIDPTSKFYTLVKKRHWDEWATQMEEYIDQWKRRVRKYTREKEHEARRKYANDIGTSLLYKTEIFILRYILDVLHVILRHAVSMQGALTIMCHCSLRLSISQTISILSHSCMFNKYINFTIFINCTYFINFTIFINFTYVTEM